MLNIGLDLKGSDNGAMPFIMASLDVICKNNEITFTLYGVKDEVEDILLKQIIKRKLDKNIINSRYLIIDSKETIEMNDHPVLSLRTKTNSSIVKAGDDLCNDKIDCLISGGSTGALLALSQFYIKTIDGIDRAVVGTVVPTRVGMTLILDMGANMDPKAEWLHQYANIANIYFREMYNKPNPTIGLLSVGVEENKGNQLINDTYKLLKTDDRLNFIGNVEARDIPEGICDILVCDGFSGNVLLKMYEGVSKTLLSLIKEKLKSSIISKIGAIMILPSLKSLLKKFDAKSYGGAPFLGCKKLIIKCHGNCSNKEVYNAIYQAIDYLNNNITEKIITNFKGA